LFNVVFILSVPTLRDGFLYLAESPKTPFRSPFSSATDHEALRGDLLPFLRSLVYFRLQCSVSCELFRDNYMPTLTNLNFYHHNYALRNQIKYCLRNGLSYRCRLLHIEEAHVDCITNWNKPKTSFKKSINDNSAIWKYGNIPCP